MTVNLFDRLIYSIVVFVCCLSYAFLPIMTWFKLLISLLLISRSSLLRKDVEVDSRFYNDPSHIALWPPLSFSIQVFNKLTIGTVFLSSIPKCFIIRRPKVRLHLKTLLVFYSYPFPTAARSLTFAIFVSPSCISCFWFLCQPIISVPPILKFFSLSFALS